MIPLVFTYATPSVFESTRDRAVLGLSADASRPVRFDARVSREVLSVRTALQALGALVWSSDEWRSDEDFAFTTLDPVITVHPDRVFFEAFSQDQSSYGLVIIDRALFSTEGEVQTGTTNVDFTGWLWASLAEMRSSRETRFQIGAEGFEVSTTSGGGRFEQKVDLPDEWVRGFLQLQGAMAMPGTKLSVRPVDLLAAIRFLRFTKAKVSPRALRYELEPGQDAALLLEPWEHRVPLVHAEHSFTDRRVIRTWGRRRLRLLEPLLPYADRVDVYLKGRALPSFYAVKLGEHVTFVLGLSGWTAARWTGSASFELLVRPSAGGDLRDRTLAFLVREYSASIDAVAAALGCNKSDAASALRSLCAEGRAIFDIESRAFRHRELFRTPVDPTRLYPPDERRDAAEELVRRGAVAIQQSTPRETKKTKRLKTPDGPVYREIIYRDWVVTGDVGEQRSVELVLNDEDRVIFGKCGCEFFRQNILNRGPCAHLLALHHVFGDRRKDLASSTVADAPAPAPAPAPAGAADEPGLDESEPDDDND